ncbi:MAG: ROK family protein [Bacteroidales bacterium]|nr:ROK family protein [Bacteroidales bacterium]
MQNTYAIGIDVGGTNTDMGLVRDDATIVARRSLPTGNYTQLEPYIHDIMNEITALVAKGDPVKGVDSIALEELTGIGVGAPNGNFYTGCVEWAPNLPIKGLLKFEEEFHKYVSCPVVLSNDANAAAFGEYVYGGARGMDHFVMITLGTGVGSGIVVDGKLVHGYTGTAGELGHNILIPNGRQCSCGRKGCLEAYTSARGIVQTYVELRKEKGTPADAAQHKGWIGAEVPDKEVTSKLIGDAANAGDPLAKETYAQVGEWLGLACANACTFSAPQAIFLMGGPTLVGAPLLEPLKQSFEANLLNIYKGHVDIRMSQLKANEVAILGAAALVELRK